MWMECSSRSNVKLFVLCDKLHKKISSSGTWISTANHRIQIIAPVSCIIYRYIHICRQIISKRHRIITTTVLLRVRRIASHASCSYCPSRSFLIFILPKHIYFTFLYCCTFFFSHTTSARCLFSLLLPQQPATGDASIDFSVVIAASAPVEDAGLVHAVTVIQPAQTWTVIRGQDDFLRIAENLSSQIADLPAFPEVANQFHASTAADDLLPIVTARTHLQHWLETILMYPGARDSPCIRDFLTYAPNMIPPQYENVSWTIFTADGQVASPAPAPQGNPQTGTGSSSTDSCGYDEGNLDDMVMDEMFETGDGDDVGPVHHDDSDDENEDEYRASLRYQECKDTITEEDEMDLAHVIAGEVEMIDDVGSLAQSLGASHLGRSIMLQEETFGSNANRHAQQQQQQQVFPQAGLQLGNSMSGASSGGIGSAMKHATQQIGTSFNQVKPESAPRLDAFKMIKVIGKGSFGEYF